MGATDRELELVLRAIKGDKASLTLLLAESRDQLHTYVSRKIPPELQRVISPDDVVQDTHADVFGSIGSFEPHGEAAFRRWVATIAIHKLRNALRWHRRAKRGGGKIPEANAGDLQNSSIAFLDMVAGPGRTPSRSVARGDAIEAVRGALEHLPEHYRQAVWLVYIEGRTSKEAALRMGRTERAIHGLCRRALKLLQDHLGSASKFLTSPG